MTSQDPNGAYQTALRRIADAKKNSKSELILSGLGLTTIPPEIGSLTALQTLHLDNNQLTTLPSEIGALTGLQSLYLKSNQFVELPREIGSLAGLQTLNVDRNQLVALPSEIGFLTRLQTLYLTNNQFAALPSTISALAALRTLKLYNNQLDSLPPEIGSLIALQTLDVDYNKLTTLPPEIGNLTALRELWLIQNQLHSLPSSLHQLSRLRYLILHGNPMLKLSPTVLGRDPRKHKRDESFSTAKSILDVYFGRLAGASRPLNEVKLILVGRGGAGKTSIVRALRELPFHYGEKSTSGIALSDWAIKGCKGGDVTAHVWDFAGQVITHALHQFFFSVRSVYVLVLTGRENSEREDAEYWLRLIQAFGTDENGVGPPVVVALNKWDLAGCRPKLDRGALKERYPFTRDFVEIDCQTTRGVADLRDTLKREIGELPWVHEPFPANWESVRSELTDSRRTAAYLAFDQFRRLCNEQGVRDRQEQESLAEVLHNLGSALNYRNDMRLREATVLKPQWLTENVYALMRKAERHGGVLKRVDVDKSLVQIPEREMRDYLVRIMERFEIAYAHAGKGDLAGPWAVPQALPDDQPPGSEEFAKIQDATRLRYKYQALPEGLVARAVVRVHDFIEEKQGRKLQWASGAILAREGARALIRKEPQDRIVMITVTGPTDARRQLAGLCQAEMREIHNDIQGLDPEEETQVDGHWVLTAALEKDERRGNVTGVLTKVHGTVRVDSARANDAYSKPDARKDELWKPKVFISYSKKNIRSRERLESELKVLRNEGLLAGHWHDRMIDPGVTWDPAIRRELKDADIILFLLTSASLATEYIAKTEIPSAMELHASNQAVVIPLILESCRWDSSALKDLQVVPTKGRPVDEWETRSQAWKSVSDGLAKVCEKLIAANRGKRSGFE